MRTALWLLAPLAAAVAVVAPVRGQPGAPQVPMFRYAVVRALPHDDRAFTQGLEIVNGVLYEGTGIVGQSTIRRVDLTSGKVLQKRETAVPHFGEGITLFNGRLFQLTWQTRTAFTYDPATFRETGTFKYAGEGWGLTHDRTHLIMSDGSEYLRRIDPATFAETGRVRVMAAGQPLKRLNELEYVKGEVLANVWLTDYIAKINPATGQVTGYIDLRGLMPPGSTSGNAVLNGIAYDDANDRLYVTGKLWPRIFEIKIAPK